MEFQRRITKISAAAICRMKSMARISLPAPAMSTQRRLHYRRILRRIHAHDRHRSNTRRLGGVRRTFGITDWLTEQEHEEPALQQYDQSILEIREGSQVL